MRLSQKKKIKNLALSSYWGLVKIKGSTYAIF